MTQMTLMTAKETAEKLKAYTDSEHLVASKDTYADDDPRLVEAALELAETSKSILGGLYYDFRKTETSSIRKAKNSVIGKIANVVRNVVERPLLTQQKFNEQTFYLLKLLLAENAKLKAKLAELDDKKD